MNRWTFIAFSTIFLVGLLLAGCAGKYVCFPPSTCRRAEWQWKALGHMECLSTQVEEQMKELNIKTKAIKK